MTKSCIGVALMGFVFALVAATGAQQPVRDNAALEPPRVGTAMLAGIVRDDAGKPVRRASVTATGNARFSRTAISDNQGRFALSALPAGRLTLTATKPGFAAMSYGAMRPNRPGSGLVVAEGQVLRDLEIVVPRGAVLTGTVFDERGQPMPGVPVMAWEVRTTLAAQRTLDFPANGGAPTYTDDRGAYRLYGLPAGEYTVGTFWAYSGLPGTLRVPTDAEIQAAFALLTRTSPGRAAPTATPPPAPAATGNYARVFLPDSVDPLAAVTVSVAAGEERAGLDLRMQFRPMPTIQASVAGIDGAPQPVRVELTSRSSVLAFSSTSVTTIRSDATYVSRPLAPGDYTVRARSIATGNQPALSAVLDLTVSGSEPIAVTLNLAPTATMSGRLVFESSNATPVGNVQSARVSVAPPVPGSSFQTSPIDPSGAFTVAGVEPGRFRVTAAPPTVAGAPSPWMLKSVLLGDRDVTDQAFELARGTLPTLTVTFTDRISELTGTMLDGSGQPTPNYFVVVIPADRQSWMQNSRRIVSTRPDTVGRFAFRALPPGDYRIAATTDLVPNDLQDAKALERLLAESAPLTVGVGEKKVFDIRLAR